MDLAGDKRLRIGDAARRGCPDGARRRTGLTAQLARRPWLAPVALAALMAAVALITAVAADLPLRDPDGIFGERMRLMLGAVALFVALDIVPRALARSGWSARGVWANVRAVARERYTKRRTAVALTGVLTFYVTYVAYRNLKSFLPFLTDQDLDVPLLELERSIFFGTDPAVLLHDVLGTGPVVTHFLSAAYLFYLAFVPLTVGFASVWSTQHGAGFWYVTALGLNWTLGVLTYYLLPALGPVFIVPELFGALPESGTSILQEVLVEHRAQALQDPFATSNVQSIAAFASLHVSVVFSAALIAHHLRVHRAVRIFLWVFLGVTLLSTVYFGWHYVIDDVAGLVLGAVAVYAAAFATGQRVRGRSEEEAGDVVAGDHREEDRVDAVEDAPVGAERTPAVLPSGVALEGGFEQVADGGRDGHGDPQDHRAPALEGAVGDGHEDDDSGGSADDARS